MMESILEDWEKNASVSHMIAGTLETLELLSLTQTITTDDIDAAIGSDG
jgi:hypothetical protein